MKQFVAPVLCFSLLFTGVLFLLRGSSIEAPALARLGRLPETRLESSTGAELKSSDLHGNVVLWNFFFTACEGPCPKLQAEMLKLQEQLKRTANVKLVSVSVDYETDTPATMKAYAEKLGADLRTWEFVRIQSPALESLATDGFKLGIDPGNLIHSTRIVLVDPTGEVRGLYDSTEPEKLGRLVADAKRLSASWSPTNS